MRDDPKKRQYRQDHIEERNLRAQEKIAMAQKRAANAQERAADHMKWSLVALAATAFFTFLTAVANFLVAINK